MKLLRFITQEEYEMLKAFSQQERLQSNNKSNYYHAENMEDDLAVKAINTLLREVIEDFVSFSNFVKSNPVSIRLQYEWDERFTGVGWVTIDELRDGFAVEEDAGPETDEDGFAI